METTYIPPIRTVYILDLNHLAKTYQHYVMGNDENEHFTSVAKILTADYSAGAELFYNFGRQEFFVRTWEVASLLDVPESDVLANVADIVEGAETPLWFSTELENGEGELVEFQMPVNFPHTDPAEQYAQVFIPLSIADELSADYYPDNKFLGCTLWQFLHIAAHFERELASIGLFDLN